MQALWSFPVTGKLAALAGLVALAAVTPGPNNFLVLRTASRAGVRGALPAILGIVLGGLAVLAIAQLATATTPRVRLALGVAGCAYLGWLGLRLIYRAGRPSTPGHVPAASVAGLFVFQLVNPKSWIMVMTASAQPGATAAALVALFVVIPVACLLLWATAGAALARWIARPRVAAWVDRVMGGLLVLAAVVLV